MDGILVSQQLRALVASGAIRSLYPVRPAQIQPSSLDLRLGARIWQLQCSFLPGNAGVERRLGRLALDEQRLDTDRPTVLRHRGVYLAEVEEVLDLPALVHGRANPKSSTGRLDVFVRLLTEHGHSFDTVPPGYSGRLFLEITPQSFHVSVRRGDCLGQLRLATGRPAIGIDELKTRQETSPICYWSDGRPAIVSDDPPGIQMSVDLNDGIDGIAGYLALRHRPPIDLSRRDLPRDVYWTSLPVDRSSDGQVLEPEQFYIFATRERLCIPPDLCAELVPYDATKGELRTHYAGFIDSGFGLDTSGRGARLVLEIRTHDVPFLLEHGQPLFRIELLRNAEVPDQLYGDDGSNYQMQGLKLAKQFK
ncbi:MAG: 2'-deoxycytidine 5'-triphosphate deaminase [Myxococcota bacterium]